MLRILAIVAVCFGLIILRSAPARADLSTLPAWMHVRTLASEEAQQTSLESRHREAKGGAYLTAVGAGLLVAGVVHAGTLGRPGVCYEPDDRLSTPIAAGLTVAAAGLVMTVFGVRRLRMVAQAQRRLSVRSTSGMVMASLATAAVASGLLFAIAAPEWAGCISS